MLLTQWTRRNGEMAVSNKAAEKVRLTLDLSSALNDDLDELSRTTGKSKSELMRLAIDVLLRAQTAKAENMNVGAWRDDPVTRTRLERVFLGI